MPHLMGSVPGYMGHEARAVHVKHALASGCVSLTMSPDPVQLLPLNV